MTKGVVSKITDQFLEAGESEVSFDVSHLSSGIYFYRIEAGKFRGTKKMMLLK